MENDLIILGTPISVDTVQLANKQTKTFLCDLECFQIEPYLNKDHHSML